MTRAARGKLAEQTALVFDEKTGEMRFEQPARSAASLAVEPPRPQPVPAVQIPETWRTFVRETLLPGARGANRLVQKRGPRPQYDAAVAMLVRIGDGEVVSVDELRAATLAVISPLGPAVREDCETGELLFNEHIFGAADAIHRALWFCETGHKCHLDVFEKRVVALAAALKGAP